MFSKTMPKMSLVNQPGPPNIKPIIFLPMCPHPLPSPPHPSPPSLGQTHAWRRAEPLQSEELLSDKIEGFGWVNCPNFAVRKLGLLWKTWFMRPRSFHASLRERTSTSCCCCFSVNITCTKLPHTKRCPMMVGGRCDNGNIREKKT